MKVIDIHSHICWPGPWANLRDELLKCFYDIEGLLERQEEGGVDISVVSSPSFVVEEQDETEWLDYIKRYNNFAAELASRHPGRFIGMATAIAYKGGEFLKETERAVSDYGLRGVRIASSVKGEYLDSPRAADFFSQVCQLDTPVFVHPPTITVGADNLREYGLMVRVGRTMDTTLTIARLVLSGKLEKFPRAKLIFAHLGGSIPMLSGRLNLGYTFGYARPGQDQFSLGPEGSLRLSKPPSEYLKQIYVDSVGSFHPAAITFAVETLGADHVLLGSDCPPLGVSLRCVVEEVTNLPLDDQDKAKILGGNASRLLGL